MIFLFEFKMGCKAAETTHNINNIFGQELELLTNLQGSGDSRSLPKEMRHLRLRGAVVSHQKLVRPNGKDHQS